MRWRRNIWWWWGGGNRNAETFNNFPFVIYCILYIWCIYGIYTLLVVIICILKSLYFSILALWIIELIEKIYKFQVEWKEQRNGWSSVIIEYRTPLSQSDLGTRKKLLCIYTHIHIYTVHTYIHIHTPRLLRYEPVFSLQQVNSISIHFSGKLRCIVGHSTR